MFREAFYDKFIVRIVNEIVLGSLVHTNSKLGGYIAFQLIVVPIQVIRCDVGQNRDMRLKCRYPIQLETTDLQHIILCSSTGHIQGKTVSDVSG